VIDLPVLLRDDAISRCGGFLDYAANMARPVSAFHGEGKNSDLVEKSLTACVSRPSQSR
jgi:hypothetical protein